jgi:CheY-like chemotaxis protein
MKFEKTKEEWKDLGEEIVVLPPEKILNAIMSLLCYKSPPDEVYNFLKKVSNLVKRNLTSTGFKESTDMKILILDDDNIRHIFFKKKFIGHDVESVYTAEAAIEALQRERYDAVFLDHDLGGHMFVDSYGQEATGYTVAKWLSENPDRKPEQIIIHSFNNVGAKNMHNILPGSIIAPGCWVEMSGGWTND